MTGLALRSAAKSDIGLLRSGNEDSAYAGANLLVVADGMGGQAAGEVASAAVVARFALLDELELSPAEALAALSATAEEANDTVLELMTADEELTGMGTTLTAIAWLGDRIALVHVGDSRAYLLRDGELSQLTHDHTYVQTLVDAGRITADEAVVHPRRNLLMRAIDGSPPVEADLSIREARLGDRYLLCSDGLSGVLPESDLAEVLCLGDPTGAVTALVERALAAGAPDNVTCVVADVVETVDVIEAPGVVVGAAAEARVRRQLPGIAFPADVEPAAEPEDPARVAAEAPAKRTARHRWRLTALLVAAVTLGVVLTMTAVTVWGQSQYFVGQQNDMVAIYRGIPQGILGVQLSSLVQQTNIPVTSLPSYDRLQLGETIAAKSLDDARGIVAHLRLDSASAG
jgi:serine/threonine protein phosphatase PrpC